MSALSKLESHYAVVRSIRISNAKKEPPRTSDAKFDNPPPQAAPEMSLDAAAPDAQPSAPAAGRILSQVLGMEEVQVFVRIDLMQFLPPAKLP
jgi:hypothetical protein